MVRINWTSQALNDLEAICEFIARDAPRYAQLFANRVFEVVEQLRDFPLLGRVVPEIGRDDIREIILGNYRVIYRIIPDEVEILTIYHGARLFDSSKIKFEI